MNDDEIWKTYPEIEWLQGSRLGEIRTIDHYVVRKNGRKQFVKGHVLPQRRNKNGYMYVYFSINGKTVGLRVHRIIASCFLSNTDNLPQVNHKNCDPTDNRVENLEWCSREYNNNYREKYGTACNRPVVAVSIKTLEPIRFKSQGEAAKQLGAYNQHINHVIKGKRKTHHGYWFTNADNHAVENTRVKFGDIVARKVEELMINKELQLV